MAPAGKANALPIIIVGLIVCGLPAYALATLFGAGSVAMIAMMVSLFTFISITGGSLLADMKTAAAVAPLIFVAATVPRLVSEWNAVAGAVAACACMLVVALLPLHDERLGNARMGSGMAVIFSYAMTLPGEFAPAHFVVAIAVAVAWPVLLRLAVGARDPDKATRESVAGLLDAGEPDLEGVLHAWLLGGRKLWQAKVISAACRSRAGVHMLRLIGRDDGRFDGLAAQYAGAAAQVADQVRAKVPDSSRQLVLPDAQLEGEAGRMSGQAADGLVEAHEAATARPAGATTRPSRESLRAVAGKPLLRERKVQIAHAARTFIGMSVMIALTTALLPAGSSLKASALLCTFAILQSSWHATLAKSKARIVGVSAGMVASIALTAVLPAHAMLPVAMACMLLGMWFMLSNPALAYFFMAVMSIGMAVGTRGVDPGSYIVEYLVVIAAAIIVRVRGYPPRAAPDRARERRHHVARRAVRARDPARQRRQAHRVDRGVRRVLGGNRRAEAGARRRRGRRRPTRTGRAVRTCLLRPRPVRHRLRPERERLHRRFRETSRGRVVRCASGRLAVWRPARCVGSRLPRPKTRCRAMCFADGDMQVANK